MSEEKTNCRPDPSRRTVNMWIRDFPELQFDGIELYCRSCKKALAWKAKSNVMKHISSENHKRSVSGTTTSDRQRDFNLDLVEVMLGCNIPWSKLDHPLFRQFLQKCVSGQYTNVMVPSESTLRKNYTPTCTNTRNKISSELEGKYIWMSVEETTNASGSKLANVLVGGLDENCPMRGHLITCKVLGSESAKAVMDIVHVSLRTLWGDQYAESGNKLLLFITDSSPHMEEAAVILKETCQSVLHLTCLAHGLHKIAETIREFYPNVDKLMTAVSKVFYKAPYRVRLFHEILPNTPLPPELSLARCGTWLHAVSYYYSNFDSLKSVLQQLNLDDVLEVFEAQQAFRIPDLQANLEYIHASFSRIPLALRELERKPESTEFTTVDAMNVVFDLRRYIFELSGGIVETVKEKFEEVLKSNPGFSTMSHIVDLLSGKGIEPSTQDLNSASLQKFSYFKYAPVTLMDLEGNYFHRQAR